MQHMHAWRLTHRIGRDTNILKDESCMVKEEIGTIGVKGRRQLRAVAAKRKLGCGISSGCEGGADVDEGHGHSVCAQDSLQQLHMAHFVVSNFNSVLESLLGQAGRRALGAADRCHAGHVVATIPEGFGNGCAIGCAVVEVGFLRAWRYKGEADKQVWVECTTHTGLLTGEGLG